MSKSELISDLKNAGFSDQEAKVYLALYEVGSGTAYEVAKAAQLQVPNTYNVIRALSSRGAARMVSEKPARYVAIEPEILFGQLASEMSQLCASIVDQFETLKPESSVSFVEIIQSEARILDKFEECFENASTQIILKGANPLPQRVREALGSAAKRGVQCLFVHYGQATTDLIEAGVLCWPHEGNGVRLGMGEDYLTVCYDFEKAIIHRTAPDSEAAYSENRSFVYMTSVMIRHEIYLAEIMTALEPEIEAKFGPGLYKVRAKYSITPLGKAFEDFVASRESAA